MVATRKSLNQHVKEKLEALSAGVLYFVLISMVPTGVLITIYVLFCTKYWYVAIIYLVWIWVIDKDTPEGVGRVNNWVKSWNIFKYAARYFPVTVHFQPGIELDNNLNYLACCYPHGVMPTGIILGFQANAEGKNPLGSNHTTHGIMLKNLFYVPIYREIMLSLGLCSANAKSIERILSHPGGGKIVGLIAGGTAEMFYTQEGQYRITLKNRKGFVKIALRTGSPILPTFSFGENSIYKQKVFPEGSFMRRFQEWFKVKLGFPPVLFYGRGLFQDTFGIIPMPNPINVVVGKPVDVLKIENPTQEDIDALHRRFTERLTALFEEYKYLYEPDPENSNLIIV